MAQFINTNVASLNAQRNLTTSQTSLATSLTRLSSGLRINSARDDAAGLAISERFTAQIRGLNQAARNANDGISLAQTAEGDLATVSNNLQRIRELAVQSANSTNSASDRVALQQEASQLVEEINRVAATSSFNNVKLLDGTFASSQFQVGANANETVTVAAITSVKTDSLSGSTYDATLTGSAVSSAALASGDLSINGVAIGASKVGSSGAAAGFGDDSAIQKAAAINIQTVSSGVTATAQTTTVTGTTGNSNALAADSFQINGVNIGSIGAGTDVTNHGVLVETAINAVSAQTGVVATDNGSGAVTLTAADGRNVVITGTTTDTGLSAGTTRATIKLDSTSSQGIVIAGTTPGVAGFSAGTTTANSTVTTIADVDISTVSGANTAIAAVDGALTSVSSVRATLGAVANRFESVVTSLTTTSENLSAARSRILDADFAAETANLTRTQVLQQAGIAILSQANSLPQLALSLLQ